MHGHIPPQLIEKYPWIGVIIGIMAVVLFTLLDFVAARDYVNFSKQKFPEHIDAENVGPDTTYTRRWVILTNPILLCERVDQVHRTDPLEKLTQGPVYDTYIPITNSSGKELVIGVFDGDATCSNDQNHPLIGILTTTEDHSYGLGFFSTRLSKTTTARLILYVGEGLEQTRLNLILALVLTVALIPAPVYFFRFWLKVRQERLHRISW